MAGGVLVGIGVVAVGMGAAGSVGLPSVGDRREQPAIRSSSRRAASVLVLLMFLLDWMVQGSLVRS